METIKSHTRCTGFGIVCLLSFLIVAFSPGTGRTRSPFTLGDAKSFLILSTEGDTRLGNVTITKFAIDESVGDIGGHTVTLGSNSTVAGDMIGAINPGVGISLGNFAKVRSTCITNGSAVHLGTGAICTNFDVSGSNYALIQFAGAAKDARGFANTLASFPVDQVLDAIDIPASHSLTIACEASWVNVVDIPSIRMGGSSTLKIDCPAGDILLMNVPGALTLGAGVKIALTGGITADAVAFNITGTSSIPAITGGASSILNGTLLAAGRPCQLNTGVTIHGQVVCGGDVDIGANLKATYIPLIPF